MNVYLTFLALRKFSTYPTWYLPVPLLSTTVPIKVILLRRVHLVPVPATHCLGVAGQFEVEYRHTVSYYCTYRYRYLCNLAQLYHTVHCTTLLIFVFHCGCQVHCNLQSFYCSPSVWVHCNLLPILISAQLYMIAKKSRQESKGADSGSGVEILVSDI
jgi:hypothetical protein